MATGSVSGPGGRSGGSGSGAGGGAGGAGGWRRKQGKPLPPVEQEKKELGGEAEEEEEDILLFDDEDEEDLAAFMEEYDALEDSHGEEPPPLLVEEFRVEEAPDGSMRMVSKGKKSPAGEEAVQSLLREAKAAGGMTEDDWFEFLRRTGMQRELESSSLEEEMDGTAKPKGPKPLRRGRQVRKGPPKFVDRIGIAVSGGKGGKGCISFEAVHKGRGAGGAIKRPSGGHGGQGGDVIFVADPMVQSLEMDRHHFHGRDGESGDSNNKRGARGKHTVIRVPCGTVVKEVRRVGMGPSAKQYEPVEVCDLDEPMSYYTAATGGKPGLGNSIQAGRARKASSASGTFRSPGHQGEQRFYQLELKTIADVGLVGYPNAGKSTLLGGLSRAKPKVAAYPFTTLHPTVGRVEFTDAASVTVADLPGLIEGAHANKGLGHEFLRHIERTKVLLYVLDGLGGERPEQDDDDQGKRPNEDGSIVEETPAQVLRKLKEELELYSPGLSRRPSLIWLNKADLDPQWVQEAKAQVEAVLREEMEGQEEEEYSGGSGDGSDSSSSSNSSRQPPLILWGSAKTGERIGDLAHALRRAVEKVARTRHERSNNNPGGPGPGTGPRPTEGRESSSETVSHGGSAGAEGARAGMAGGVDAATFGTAEMKLAQAYAQALDATQRVTSEWSEGVNDATERNHRARCYAAGLEVGRRYNYWLARSIALAVETPETATQPRHVGH